jgi:hypothetical protein
VQQTGRKAIVALFDAGSSAYQGTTVTNSVTQVFSTSGLTNPQGLVVINQGTATVYVGGGSVTSANAIGGTLFAGQMLYFSGPAQNMWAITAAGTSTVVAGLATTVGII